MTHLADQVGVPGEAYLAYDWRGRTIKYHRVQIRTALRFRETTVEDAGRTIDWLADEVLPHERVLDHVRAAVSARCRALRLEPTTPERSERLVRSALASHEQRVAGAVRGRLSAQSVEALDGLLTPAEPTVPVGESARAMLVELKTDPGPAGLESVLAEIAKLQRLRAIELPADLFADMAPKARRVSPARSGGNALRTAARAAPVDVLAAWAAHHAGELTDNLVEVLVQTIERIEALKRRQMPESCLPLPERVLGSVGDCGLVSRTGYRTQRLP